MKPLAQIPALIVGMFVMVSSQAVGWDGPPAEPSEAYLVNEDINSATGFYTREYSLSQDGIVDYKTARQIIVWEYNEYWNSIVETKEYPLFYWHDPNRDGEWVQYVDRNVEGCHCDIVRYEVKGETPLISRTH